jgi:glutathione S-transferase
MEFVYWPIKGLAEHIRWLLNYCGVEYHETSVNDYDQWLAQKNGLGLPFPNLPYIVDSDFKLSESQAIARYICAKFKPDLLGKDFTETARIENIAGVLADVLQPYTNHIADKENIRESIEAGVSRSKTFEKVEQLAAFLGEKEYFHGRPTLNDIEFGCVAYRLWTYCKTHSLLNPIEKHNNLFKLSQRVRRLPGIQEYLQTPQSKFVQNSLSYLTVALVEGDYPMD